MPKMENSKQRTYSYEKKENRKLPERNLRNERSEGDQLVAEATPEKA